LHLLAAGMRIILQKTIGEMNCQ